MAYSRGQALADEYGIQFFETSAKDNSNVDPVFVALAKDVMQRLQQEQQGMQEDAQEPLRLTSTFDQKQKQKSSGCC